MLHLARRERLYSAAERETCLFFPAARQGFFVSAECFRELCQRGKAVFERLFVAGVADAHALGLLKAVAGGDERARLAVHALAEVVGRDVEVVVYERSRTGLGLRVIEVLMRGDPRVEDGEILAHDGPVAVQKRVRVAKSESRDRIIKHTAADLIKL